MTYRRGCLSARTYFLNNRNKNAASVLAARVETAESCSDQLVGKAAETPEGESTRCDSAQTKRVDPGGTTLRGAQCECCLASQRPSRQRSHKLRPPPPRCCPPLRTAAVGSAALFPLAAIGGSPPGRCPHVLRPLAHRRCRRCIVRQHGRANSRKFANATFIPLPSVACAGSYKHGDIYFGTPRMRCLVISAGVCAWAIS